MQSIDSLRSTYHLKMGFLIHDCEHACAPMSADLGNWHQQIEELTALSAIFDSNFRVASVDYGDKQVEPDSVAALDESRPPIAVRCSALVHVDLPSGTVQLAVRDEAGALGENSAPSIDFGAPVHHLPPVTVHLRLTAGYPSAHAPKVTLRAVWLNSTQLRDLETTLYSLWDDQGQGAPICFTWLDYLKASSLDQLGISHKLVLSTPPSVWSATGQQPFKPKTDAPGDGVASTASSSSLHSQHPNPPQQPSTLTSGSSGLPDAAAQVDKPRTGIPAAPAPDAATAAATATPFGSSSGLGFAVSAGVAVNAASPPVPQQVHTVQTAVPSSVERSTVSSHSSGLWGTSFSIRCPAGVPLTAERLAVLLIRYSTAQQRKKFEQGIWRCGICWDDVPGTRAVQVPGCEHLFCKGCLRAQCEVHVASGAVESLCCPQPKCQTPFSVPLIQKLLPKASFQRWEDLLLQRTLDRMEDAAYCPRCSTVCIRDADYLAQCPKCMLAFCARCRQPWHGSAKCQNMEALLLQAEAAAGAGDGASTSADAGSTADQRRARAQRILDDVMSIRHILEACKVCPTCGVAIQKIDGCNKVVCSNCHGYMCWRCGAAISGYDHFGRGCGVYDEEVDEAQGHRDARAQAAADELLQATEAQAQAVLGDEEAADDALEALANRMEYMTTKMRNQTGQDAWPQVREYMYCGECGGWTAAVAGTGGRQCRTCGSALPKP